MLARDAASGVGHAQRDVGPRREILETRFGEILESRFAEILARRLDAKAPAFRHRIACVHHQIEKRALELIAIDVYRAKIRGKSRLEVDCLSQRAPDDLRHISDQRIDVDGTLSVFWSVALPLIRPAIAAVSVLVFTFVWNDYFWALVLVQSDAVRPVTAGLQSLRGMWQTSWNLAPRRAAANNRLLRHAGALDCRSGFRASR